MDFYLKGVSFLSGFAMMAMEIAIGRLIFPYLGSSLPVWGILISWVLLSASSGYAFGGKISSRNGNLNILSSFLLLASLFSFLLPLVGHHALSMAIKILFNKNFFEAFAGIFLMALITGLPVFSLGVTIPIVIRLLTQEVTNAGKTAGTIQAIATAGSILGTLVPSFWSIQSIGTKWTFIMIAFLLGFAGITGFIRYSKKFIAGFAVILPLAALSGYHPQNKTFPFIRGKILFHDETLYHSVFVVKKDNGLIELKVDEGFTIQSVYHPVEFISFGSWPYLSSSFFLRNTFEVPKHILVIGLAGGTVAKQIKDSMSNVIVKGVEIDGKLIQLGRKFMGLPDSVKIEEKDGRVYLSSTDEKFDTIILDAYQGPYPPFHLLTKEFFTIVRDHLEPDGIVAVNMIRWKNEKSLSNAAGCTLKQVFKYVFKIDVPFSINTIFYASMQSIGFKQMNNSKDSLEKFAERNLKNIIPFNEQCKKLILTDDCAPVEYLTHKIFFSALF